MANLKISSGSALDKRGFTQSYPSGTIIISMSSVIPDGWLLCDGRLVAQSDYPELYSSIGSAYGVSGADFNLPPLVVNATYNTNPRIPVAQLDTESSYPNSFGHNHGVTINSASVVGHSIGHDHPTNTGLTAAATVNHNHGATSGNTSGSNTNGTSSPGRLAGPAGPFASGPSGGVGHAHGGVGINASASNGTAVSHQHGTTAHTTTSFYHNHASNISSSSHTASTSSVIYPLSKQVYFLIKT